MDWLGEFVYIPVWLLGLLVFLASGAAQYLLVGAVRLIIRISEEREREQREAQAKLHRILHPGKD